MAYNKTILAVISVFALASSVAAVNYSWKPYNGTIPSDAVVGASSPDGLQYIARGPVENNSLWIGPISKGQDTIQVPSPQGIKYVSEHIEILCTSEPKSAVWIYSTADASFADQTALVTGGYYFDDLSAAYVGRVYIDANHFAIGNIVEFNLCYLYVTNGTTLFYASAYEVLRFL